MWILALGVRFSHAYWWMIIIIFLILLCEIHPWGCFFFFFGMSVVFSGWAQCFVFVRCFSFDSSVLLWVSLKMQCKNKHCFCQNKGSFVLFSHASLFNRLYIRLDLAHTCTVQPIRLSLASATPVKRAAVTSIPNSLISSNSDMMDNRP